jgi:hypothetical protein
MADKNIVIQRNNAGTIDNIYPQTQWGNVLNKPTTFTPTSHTHGNITNEGTITADTAIASGQKFVLVNGSNAIVRSALALGSSTTTFLRNDGQWVTPAGGGTVTGTGTLNELTYWTGVSSIGALTTATYPSLTELSRVKGLTSAVQTQLDGKAPTSHASAATTYGVGTNANYGHVRGATRLTGATDGESGVAIVSGIAYATKTLRVNGVAQQSWGTLLDLDTTEGSILRFVNLTITRIEGGITYYIGSITVDVNVIPTNNFTTTPSPTVTSGYRWRLPSQNSSNTQVTLPIYMYRNTVDNALRVYVDQATAATYDYECVGYF